MALKILIDSGHGGKDPGAVGNGIVEKDMNLNISKVMYDEFKRLGIPVYMLRDTDETLSPSDRINRISKLVNKDDDVILISNHINAGGGEGAEVIYSLRNNEKLSQGILNELANEGQKIRRAYQRRGTNNPNLDYYYILRESKPYESIIVEYGFLDNTKDADRLKNNYKKYALATINAILDYKGIAPNNTNYYIVKRGDTLYSIAKRFNTTVDNLKNINNLKSNIITIGQKLFIKDNFIYKVAPSDTLYSIAKRYNTTVQRIKEINNLYTDLIKVGDKLIIPS